MNEFTIKDDAAGLSYLFIYDGAYAVDDLSNDFVNAAFYHGGVLCSGY